MQKKCKPSKCLIWKKYIENANPAVRTVGCRNDTFLYKGDQTTILDIVTMETTTMGTTIVENTTFESATNVTLINEDFKMDPSKMVNHITLFEKRSKSKELIYRITVLLILELENTGMKQLSIF